MQKNKGIHIKVSETEIDMIHKRMEEVGAKNMSAYLLKMALNGYVINLDMSDFKEILRLVRISSNNLNQYAKKANETGSIYREDIEELKRSHKKIIFFLGNILRKLSRFD